MVRKVLMLFYISITVSFIRAQTPFDCKGQYYLSLTKTGIVSSGLYQVILDSTGHTVILDTLSSSVGLTLNAMGYRVTDNLIYGMDPGSARLRKIGSDGMAIDLGRPKDIPLGVLYYAGDVTPDGNYLLVIGIGGSDNKIVRIDLNDVNYQCTFVPIQDRTVRLVDIAFDPFTGILYGHDLNSKRIVTLDPNTGAVNNQFNRQQQVDQLGALFFDAFGNLYGYGSFGTTVQNKFVSINKTTGDITLIAEGPVSSGQDGCACPYTLEMQKIVTPDTAIMCTDVLYSFIVANGSGETRRNVTIIDTMPTGFVINKVVHNPYDGEVRFSGNTIEFSQLTVPPGIDTIHISVHLGMAEPGTYYNQAVLSGLPISLGSFTLSDNPYTTVQKDSTPLTILPLDVSWIESEISTCVGQTIEVDYSIEGVQFLWENGSTVPIRELMSPGEYQIHVQTGCEDKIIDISVRDDALQLALSIDSVTIQLGENVVIGSTYFSPSPVEFSWEYRNKLNGVECSRCNETTLYPLFDDEFTLTMTDSNGCEIADKVLVRVIKDRMIYTPNILSANDDGQNDYFTLYGSSSQTSIEYLRIYDRWGNLVFETNKIPLNEPQLGWNGKLKNQDVVLGVYTWVASLRFLDGYSQLEHGDVTVIK